MVRTGLYKQVVHNKYKSYLFHLALVVTVYLFYLFVIKPGVDVRLEMRAASDSVGQVFYLTSSDTNHAERNSVKYNVKKGLSMYEIHLPGGALLSGLRLDPVATTGRVELIRLDVWRATPFYREHYKADLSLDNIINLNQIASLPAGVGQGLVFASEGGDPFLVFKSLTRSEKKIDLAFFQMLIIATVIIMGSVAVRVMRDGCSVQDRNKWIISFVVFLIMLLKLSYYNDNVRFGVPPDETAHYQYAMHLISERLLLPEFGNMKISGVVHSNYLSHPPLYYHLNNLIVGPDFKTSGRLFNHYLILLSVFLVILVLHRYYRFDFYQHAFVLTAFTSLPMLAFLGASVNNDGLGVLSGAMFFYGAHCYFHGKNYITGANIILAALFLAFFSKLTVFLLVLLSFLFLLWKYRSSLYGIAASTYILAAFVVVSILSYQLFIFDQYGAILPSLKVTNPDAYYNSGFFVPEPYRIHYTMSEWFSRMLHFFWESYFNIHAHVSLIKPLDWFGYTIIGAHVIGFGVLFISSDSAQVRIIKSMVYAILIVVFIQYLFSYMGRQSSGYTGGLQARYYLPFAMVLPVAVVTVLSKCLRPNVEQIVLVILSLFLIYGDFVYFILNTTEQVRFS